MSMKEIGRGGRASLMHHPWIRHFAIYHSYRSNFIKTYETMKHVKNNKRVFHNSHVIRREFNIKNLRTLNQGLNPDYLLNYQPF